MINNIFKSKTRLHLIWLECETLPLLTRFECKNVLSFPGILLTLAIALFHGKCYILRRTELLHGYRIPHKKIINESRTYSFGWSFYLAWICVFLCFISSFVWLYKAQDPKQTRIPGVNYIRHRYRKGRYSYFDDWTFRYFVQKTMEWYFFFVNFEIQFILHFYID